MSKNEAVAEVIWTAFKALPKRQQEKFIQRLLQDEELVEDLADILVAQSRRCDPTRPFQEVLQELE